MKRIHGLIIAAAAVMSLAACGNTSAVNSIIEEKEASAAAAAVTAAVQESSSAPAGSKAPAETEASGKEVDIDLTKLDANMLYAQISDMVNNSGSYEGKMVRVGGQFAYYQDDIGREYFAALVSDATACCSQGIEFVLDGEHKYPDDYPQVGDNIIVTGEFGSYEEDGYTYCQLKHADVKVDHTLSW
jgi:hypothetical protein